MRKIKIIKGVKDYLPGKIYEVNVNEAFSLVDGGFAESYKVQVPKISDKMMRPKRRYKKKKINKRRKRWH